jgi:hypothetical protein
MATTLFRKGKPVHALRQILIETGQPECEDIPTIIDMVAQCWKRDQPTDAIVEQDGHLREALVPKFKTLGLVSANTPVAHVNVTRTLHRLSLDMIDQAGDIQ